MPCASFLVCLPLAFALGGCSLRVGGLQARCEDPDEDRLRSLELCNALNLGRGLGVEFVCRLDYWPGQPLPYVMPPPPELLRE